MSWRLPALLGFIGIASALWLLRAALVLNHSQSSATGVIAFLVGASCMFVIGAIHLYVSHGLLFGMVVEVSGSCKAPVVTKSEGLKSVFPPIVFFKKIYFEESQASSAKYLLFISGWRPWICPVEKFRPLDSASRSGG